MSSYKVIVGFRLERPSNEDRLSQASIAEVRKRTQRPTFRKGMRRSWTHFLMVDCLIPMRSLIPGTFSNFSADPASFFILTPRLSLFM